MILRAHAISLLWVAFLAVLGGCGETDRQSNAGAAAAGPATVIAGNYPLYFFAARISDGVEGAPMLELPAIDGDPAEWIPSAVQIQALQSADLVLLNGAGAEPWLDLVSLRRRRLVDTSAASVEQLIEFHDAVPHQHGPQGEHSHAEYAFTLWLDPLLAVAQAQVITAALSELTPSHAEQYRKNMAVLQRDLLLLDRRMAAVFEQLRQRPLLFSHPVYQYLQRRYGINGASVHWEPDTQPALADWTALRELLRTHPATVMLWEDTPLSDTAARLAGRGIESVVFHMLANRPPQGDFMTAMLANAQRLERVLTTTAE